MKQIYLAYSTYMNAHKKPPSKLDDILPYIGDGSNTFPIEARPSEKECYDAVKAGIYTVVWGLDKIDRKEGSDVVFAYESRVPQGGGFVMFTDFVCVWMSAENLENSLKRKSERKK